MTIAVAAVQLDAAISDKQTNRERMADWIRKIKAEKPNCKMILFPELSVTGYDLQHDFTQLAEPIDGESFQYFSKLARQHQIYLVYGNVEQNQTGSKPYNACWFIGPDGELKHVYRKIHLTDLEEPYFTAGETLQAIETELGKMGFLICWDVAFPEAARVYAVQEVDLLIAPAAWERPYGDPYIKFCMSRALDNVTPLVTCNYVGENRSFHFTGASRILDATGSEIDTLGEQEGYVYAELDQQQTQKTRQQFYTMLKERKPHLY